MSCSKPMFLITRSGPVPCDVTFKGTYIKLKRRGFHTERLTVFYTGSQTFVYMSGERLELVDMPSGVAITRTTRTPFGVSSSTSFVPSSSMPSSSVPFLFGYPSPAPAPAPYYPPVSGGYGGSSSRYTSPPRAVARPPFNPFDPIAAKGVPDGFYSFPTSGARPGPVCPSSSGSPCNCEFMQDQCTAYLEMCPECPACNPVGYFKYIREHNTSILQLQRLCSMCSKISKRYGSHQSCPNHK